MQENFEVKSVALEHNTSSGSKFCVDVYCKSSPQIMNPVSRFFEYPFYSKFTKRRMLSMSSDSLVYHALCALIESMDIDSNLQV